MHCWGQRAWRHRHAFSRPDARWAGASSLDFLARVVELIAQKGYRIANVDSTLLPSAEADAAHSDDTRKAGLGAQDRCGSSQRKAKTMKALGPWAAVKRWRRRHSAHR